MLDGAAVSISNLSWHEHTTQHPKLSEAISSITTSEVSSALHRFRLRLKFSSDMGCGWMMNGGYYRLNAGLDRQHDGHHIRAAAISRLVNDKLNSQLVVSLFFFLSLKNLKTHFL